jgi:hypothetical protein
MCRQVNDGQAPMAERQRPAIKETLVIRSAPSQLCRHALQCLHVGNGLVETQLTTDAAHAKLQSIRMADYRLPAKDLGEPC